MKRLIFCLACFAIPEIGIAANPSQVALGLQLFTKEYASTAPGQNGDGLGPVFNESSCVACHNLGGVGGSGEVPSNARAIGLSQAEFTSIRPKSSMEEAIQEFSPGFLAADGSILASFTLHRRGGSFNFTQLRDRSLSVFNPQWDDDSKLSTDTVHAERQPTRILNATGNLILTTHVFARNTPALFGTGLINQIPDSAIWDQANRQKGSSEISGRPGTLEDGRIGKFGWRANFATLLEFTETACANELGLQSKRVKQANDLTQPNYRNLNPDLTDEMIGAMNTFIASLPRPSRSLPDDAHSLETVRTGEQRFIAIGCVDCHTANMGSLADLYSDLLLHDMGPNSIDLAAAPPYRRQISLQEKVEVIHPLLSDTSNSSLTSTGGYSGSVASMAPSFGVGATSNRQSPPHHVSALNKKIVLSPPTSPPKQILKPLGKATKSFDRVAQAQGIPVTQFKTQTFIVSNIEPTLVNQEWKTPPLWGVRDSAPYMHDGRAETVLEAIAMHDGEGRGARNRFFALSHEDQQAILEFLDTFVAPTQGVIEAPKRFTRRDLVSR